MGIYVTAKDLKRIAATAKRKQAKEALAVELDKRKKAETELLIRRKYFTETELPETLATIRKAAAMGRTEWFFNISSDFRWKELESKRFFEKLGFVVQCCGQVFHPAEKNINSDCVWDEEYWSEKITVIWK